MKRNRNTLKSFLLLFALVISSCSSELKEFSVKVREIFPYIEKGQTMHIIIIPNQGCGGCINYAEEFYNINKSNNNFRFIFTNIISIKLLKQKIKINKDNTYIDAQNEIIKLLPPDAKIYPSVITFKDGVASEIKYQSPYEEALYFLNDK